MYRTVRKFAVPTLCLLLVACSGEEQKQQAAAPPPSAVSFVEVKPETMPVESELPGRVAPLVTADIKPRITGLVVKRVFEQGSIVNQGDILYKIDPSPFEAKVDAARAALETAVAGQTLASQKADRQIQLSERGVGTTQDRETAVAELAQANGDVSRARADLRTAELDLQYTDVKAPISGRIGRALVTEGELVSPQSDAMATIQQLDPIYADFTQPADTLVTLRNAVSNGMLAADASKDAILRLVSEQGMDYPHEGKLLFSEASVNSQTGQLILRAEFPNPEGNLLPGMYVRTIITQGSMKNALAVPEQAVQRDTAGVALIYVVGKEDKVEVRKAELGWIVDGKWVVVKGLNPGDRVIVAGFQKIGPGMPVKPEPWNGKTPAGPAPEQEG